MLGQVNPVPGAAPAPHNPTPSTLGAVSSVNRPQAAGAPLGKPPKGPQLAPLYNPTPPSLGVAPSTVHAHHATPPTLGVAPGAPRAPISPGQVIQARSSATPTTLGAVPQQAAPHGPLYPKANPQAPSPGQIPLHLRAQHRALPHLTLAPRGGRQTPIHNYAPGTIKLSILIPTLTKRAELLGALMRKLEHQIKELGPVPEVEVLIYEDQKQHPIGAKRNRLLSEAQGDFVVFVDDDDDLSDDYVWQIYTAILDHRNADCFGFRAMITTNGQNPQEVVYSLNNRQNGLSNGTHLRPPGHLTPIRRTIAQRFRFPDAKNFGEDTDWAMSMVRSSALKSEFFIDKILYHYRFSSYTSETVGAWPSSPPAIPTYSVVILSAQATNLEECIGWLLEKEPHLPRNRIIVVDDGARAGWSKGDPGVRWVPGAKPFVFSRNANIGIRAADTDVLLLNDDARLTTRFGFTSLSFAARSRPDIGLCSSAVSGVVGNPNQHPWEVAAGLRSEPHSLAFIAVYIPKTVYQRLGPLDEQFTGYGYEDNDYCERSKKSGLGLAIYDGCIVEHSVKGNSTFRTKSTISSLQDHNRRLFNRKWNAV